jgi:hypothetical protein
MTRRGWTIAAGCLLAGLAIGWFLKRPDAQRFVSDSRPGGGAGPRDARHRRSGRPAAALGCRPATRRSGCASGSARCDRHAALDVGDPEVVAFAMWWARFDPEATIAWTATEWRAQSRLVVGAAFRSWAHDAPQKAYAYIPKVPEFYSDAAIDATIVGWHESGKPDLVASVQSLPEGAFRQHVSESLARRMVLALGAEGATRWLDSLQDPMFRDSMTMRVMSAAAEQGKAAEITAWATAKVTSGDQSPSGFPRRIGTRWILRDPRRHVGLAVIAARRRRSRRWSHGELSRLGPLRAGRRNASGPRTRRVSAGPNRRSRSTRACSQRTVRRRHSRSWRASPTAELRDRITIVITRKWLMKDPKAASAWLAKADLPPDVRARAGGPALRAQRARSSPRRGAPTSGRVPP